MAQGLGMFSWQSPEPDLMTALGSFCFRNASVHCSEVEAGQVPIQLSSQMPTFPSDT